jgi:hypothetical protein
MKKIVFAATAALFALGTSAMAQTTTAPATTTPAPKVMAPVAKPPAAPAATTTAPAATVAKPAAAKKTIGVALTETSKKCSADADAQSLKGKPRKAFRAKCIKAANAAAKKN